MPWLAMIQHLGQHLPPPPHPQPPVFTPVTWSFATDLLVELLGTVNRAWTRTGGEAAGDAAQL